MKRYLAVFFALCGILSFVSCGDRLEKETEWGATEYFKDFMFYECQSDTLERTLSVAFNIVDPTQETGPIKFDLFDAAKGVAVGQDVAQVLVNGAPVSDNVIVVFPSDDIQKIRVGIVLTKDFLDTIDGDVTLYYQLRLIENGGMERVNGVKTRTGLMLDKSNAMTINVKCVANDLKVGLCWGVVALAVILLAARLLSRVSNPPIRSTRIIVEYPDGERRYDARGCYRVVFTNAPVKVGFFHKFFVGNICVIRDEFWTVPITMEKRQIGKGLSLRTVGDYVLPDYPERGVEFIIKNERGQAATILAN